MPSVKQKKNISSVVFENLREYTDLEIEIENIWHFNTKILLVVGALVWIKGEDQEQINKIRGANSPV